MEGNGFERFPHDLTHACINVGQIGRLQVLDQIPVLPGDGYSQDLLGAVALSPLRRGLVLDSQVDIFTFYIPYRFVYGDDWVTFIEQGMDEAVTFATETSSATNRPNSLGIGGAAVSKAYPKWLPENVRLIWNRWFRPPTTVALETRLISAWGADDLTYGLKCAPLKTLASSLLANNISGSDFNVPVTAGNVSLLDIASQLGHLRTEQDREFFAVRYADIIAEFGGATDISADNRPELLLRSSFWASGYDVDGTAETSLGQYAGRVTQSFRHSIPRWFVQEHGTIVNCMLVRFPPINQDEFHYLMGKAQPTYADIAGDPEIVGSQPPFGFKTNDFFSGGDGTVRGYIPFGQWWRHHPSVVHQVFDALNGYPFISDTPASLNDLVLVESTKFDQMFQTTQLGHWQVTAKNAIEVMRRLPSASDALKTGF